MNALPIHTGYLRSRVLLVVIACITLLLPIQSLAQETSVFINEIHYDDDGRDEGEGIEIAGPAGTDLSGWHLVLYNGSNRRVYHEEALSGTIPDQDGGFGTRSFPISNIQNGSRDGIALVNTSGALVQFLSYEGILVAVDGPADGIQSSEIGVRENSRTQAGQSLQLGGTGRHYADFSWQDARGQTFGGINGQQHFVGVPTTNQPLEISCPAQIDAVVGTATSGLIHAVDPDGIIGAITTIGQLPAGIALTDIELNASEGAQAQATIAVADTAAEGVFTVTITFRNNEIPSQTAICTVRISVQTALPPDNLVTRYYEPARGLTGDALKAALHTIIRVHRNLSYGDIWDVLEDVDADPNNDQNVIELYTGRSIRKTLRDNGGSDGDRWNREHVWSRSHGLGRRGPRGRFTDAHNLHATDKSVNSDRGSKDFDFGGAPHREARETHTDSDSWEARPEVRGKIARSMFYMAVRYELNGRKPDLVLVDRTGTNSPQFGKLCVLLEWHESHPPEARELRRNERIHTVWQGNRNPFIDHPEWARSIWGGRCP